MTGPRPEFRVTGAVLAFNERDRIAAAVRSLRTQILPAGYAWESVVVVVSGSTDGTPEVVEAMAGRDPVLHVVRQPRREGKAHALAELFRRTSGDYLVVLNGDAVAAPGAVAELLASAGPPDARFAVMAEPDPGRDRREGTGCAIGLLWAVHNEFHRRSVGRPGGNHLSDELLLLPGRALPPLAPGVVNDGSYIGAWLSLHGGALRVAPRARVAISVPRTFWDHVRQRRRILYGHRQVRGLLAVEPTTVERYARGRPGPAIRLVAEQSRQIGGPRALAFLLAAEVIAGTLALIDRPGGGVDHARWRPVAVEPPATAPSVASDGA